MARSDLIKVKIPQKFENAIQKVKVNSSLDWNEACLKAADLLKALNQ